MWNYKCNATIIVPHDTPLGEILQENRHILNAARRASNTQETVPFYPPHCILDTHLSLKELKVAIKSCHIAPPMIENGVFIRPVTLEGVKAAPFPMELLPEECGECVTPGILFGYIRQPQEQHATSHRLDTTSRIAQSIGECHIKPLALRVFRLYNVEYRLNKEEGHSVLSWSLSQPQWVKLQP